MNARALACALLTCVAGAMPAQSGGTTRVLIVTGLSAEPAFARSFAAAASAVFTAAHDRWHVADSNLVYLAEDPAADRRITGKATKENVEAAFRRFGQNVRSGDVVLILLIGHGGGEMGQSAVNIPGPDPTATDYATWLVPFTPATVVFVNAATASGDFIPILAARNRILVTATKTAFERNGSEFAGFFATGLAGEADANKDGVVTVAEAFSFATARVAQSYEANSRMLSEHALMADSSHLAAQVGFGGKASSSDPRVVALLGERRALQLQLDSLRGTKSTADSTVYSAALEKLLLQIAERTRAINALQGGSQ